MGASARLWLLDFQLIRIISWKKKHIVLSYLPLLYWFQLLIFSVLKFEVNISNTNQDITQCQNLCTTMM